MLAALGFPQTLAHPALRPRSALLSDNAAERLLLLPVPYLPQSQSAPRTDDPAFARFLRKAGEPIYLALAKLAPRFANIGRKRGPPSNPA